MAVEFGEVENPSDNEAKAAKAIRDIMTATVEELHIEFLDLLPFFLEAQKRPDHGRLTFERDQHWNERGHKLVAGIVADRILRPQG
jgi:hypothetical protein